ncbi:MAG: hypothetical protein ABR562_07490 [Thermoplasmatota archaeon]
MALQISALDALVGGMATAFFGGLVAAGAYLLKQHLALREHVGALAAKLDAFGDLDEILDAYGSKGLEARRLKPKKPQSGGDGDGRR